MPVTLSNRVKSLQQALVNGGHAINVDGIMGVETYYAAMHAQNGAAAKGETAAKVKTPENGSDWLTAPVAQKSRRIDQIVIHSSATPPGMYVDLEKIREWHYARGFSDVGYHYVICRDGELQAGRKEHRTGAHVKGHNARSIGVCMVGGARNRNGKLVAEIIGHRDLAATACPSFDVQSWLRVLT